MAKVTPFLRDVESGFAHYCPGCKSMHYIRTKGLEPWSFNGDIHSPSFDPSVKITYNGADADTMRDGDRRAPSACCHYFLHKGVLEFCADSTHEFAGQKVPLPLLP